MPSTKPPRLDSTQKAGRLFMAAYLLGFGGLFLAAVWDTLHDPEARHRWLVGAPIMAGFMAVVALLNLAFSLTFPRMAEPIEAAEAAPSAWLEFGVILLGLGYSFLNCESLGRQVLELGYRATLRHEAVPMAFVVAVGLAVGVLGRIGSRRYR